MKITYLAKRIRLGEYVCHDIIADEVYFNLYLNGGASIEKITQEAEKFLAAPFPAQHPGDVIQVISVPKEYISREEGVKDLLPKPVLSPTFEVKMSSGTTTTKAKPNKKRTTKKTKSKGRGHP